MGTVDTHTLYSPFISYLKERNGWPRRKRRPMIPAAKMIIMTMVIMMIYTYKSINHESINDCQYLIYFREDHISRASYLCTVLLVFNTSHRTVGF